MDSSLVETDKRNYAPEADSDGMDPVVMSWMWLMLNSQIYDKRRHGTELFSAHYYVLCARNPSITGDSHS